LREVQLSSHQIHELLDRGIKYLAGREHIQGGEEEIPGITNPLPVSQVGRVEFLDNVIVYFLLRCHRGHAEFCGGVYLLPNVGGCRIANHKRFWFAHHGHGQEIHLCRQISIGRHHLLERIEHITSGDGRHKRPHDGGLLIRGHAVELLLLLPSGLHAEKCHCFNSPGRGSLLLATFNALVHAL
jgi:hypothetical protein